MKKHEGKIDNSEAIVDAVSPEYEAGETLDNIYKHHKPFGDQLTRYFTLRESGKLLASKVQHYCPESRERGIALTKIEEAIMWANAAIARNEKA